MEDLDRQPASMVPPRGGPRANYKRRRAEQETAAILTGSASTAPVVVFCHIRGESEPYPRRWRWGTLRLGQGPLVWQPMFRRRQSFPIPAGTTQAGSPRPVAREELSASCPNPRKAVVLPLDTPDGRIFVGLARENVDTLVAGLEVAARSRRT